MQIGNSMLLVFVTFIFKYALFGLILPVIIAIRLVFVAIMQRGQNIWKVLLYRLISYNFYPRKQTYDRRFNHSRNHPLQSGRY